MRRWFGIAVVATALFLSGCGADNGGVPSSDEHKTDTEFHDAQEGTDVKDIETYDANVQVQVIQVGDYECVLAVRGGSSEYGMAIDCPGRITP